MFKKLFLACLALVLVSGCASKPKYSYNRETFPECIVAQEELTVDNWQNYIEIKSYEGPSFDQNGNPRENLDLISNYLSIKDDKLYIIGSESTLQVEYDEVNTTAFVDQNENPIEEPEVYTYHVKNEHRLHDINPIVSMTYSGAASDEEHFTTDQYGNDVVAHISSTTEVKNLTVTNAQGLVYTLEIPEKKWYTDENGERYLIIFDDFFNLTLHIYENGTIIEFLNDEQISNSNDDYNKFFDYKLKEHPYLSHGKNDMFSYFWPVESLLFDFENSAQ